MTPKQTLVRVPMKRRRRVRTVLAYLAKCSEQDLDRVVEACARPVPTTEVH